jgi:hypothetical protein
MDGSLRDRRTIILEKEGLRSRSAREEGWIPWKSIQSIEGHGGQILLYFDHLSYVPVPGSVFADDRKPRHTIVTCLSQSITNIGGTYLRATPWASRSARTA